MTDPTHLKPDTGRAELSAAIEALAAGVRRLVGLAAMEPANAEVLEAVSLIPGVEDGLIHLDAMPGVAPPKIAPIEYDTRLTASEAHGSRRPIEHESSSEIATGILNLQQRLGGFLKT